MQYVACNALRKQTDCMLDCRRSSRVVLCGGSSCGGSMAKASNYSWQTLLSSVFIAECSSEESLRTLQYKPVKIRIALFVNIACVATLIGGLKFEIERLSTNRHASIPCNVHNEQVDYMLDRCSCHGVLRSDSNVQRARRRKPQLHRVSWQTCVHNQVGHR